MKYDSIVAQIHWFSEGEFWNISIDGYKTAEAEPEKIMYTWLDGEKEDENAAKEELIEQAKHYLDMTKTHIVCLFEGTEFDVLSCDN